MSGHLGYLDQKPAAIYAAGGRLWFAIDGQPWFLDELTATVDVGSEGQTIRIATPDCKYDVFVGPADVDDSTAFADREDRSFGLWVARIVQSPERQEVLLDVLVDAPLSEVPDHVGPTGDLIDVRRSWGKLERGASRNVHHEGSPE